MSKNKEPNLVKCSKINDDTTIRPIHEMGIKLYWAYKTSGKVHME